MNFEVPNMTLGQFYNTPGFAAAAKLLSPKKELDPCGPISFELALQSRDKLLEFIGERVQMKLWLDVDTQKIELHARIDCRFATSSAIAREVVIPIRLFKHEMTTSFMRSPVKVIGCFRETFEASFDKCVEIWCGAAALQGRISAHEYTSIRVHNQLPIFDEMPAWERYEALLLGLIEEGCISYCDTTGGTVFNDVDRESRPMFVEE